MADIIDKKNFERLAQMDPQEVTDRTGSLYDLEKGIYTINAWGGTYEVDTAGCRITCPTESEGVFHDYFSLFLLYYLMQSTPQTSDGQWVSEKDLTGGAAFFRGPHTVPTSYIIKAFGLNLDKFKDRCRVLEGKAVSMGDAAFRFEITDKIPVTVIYWLGDEDFPSEANLLFDKTIEKHLPLDIVWALAVSVCRRLSSR